MTPTRDEAVPVIHSLREYLRRVTELADAIRDDSKLSQPEINRVQALYSSLKDDAGKEAKRCSHVNSSAQLTHTESAFFCAAMTRVHIDLSPATNSHPIKSTWQSALYDADENIRTYLAQLESLFPDA